MKSETGFSLGIDIGGTSVDIALVSAEDRDVLRTIKTETTHGDLVKGLHAGLAMLFDGFPRLQKKIFSVRLSSTLATNALATGSLSPVGLVLIGYAEEDFKRWNPDSHIKARNIAYIKGGHTRLGLEREPFDSEGLVSAVEPWKEWCRGVAIASLFSLRNHEHERRAEEIVAKTLALPTVCSYKLSHTLGIADRAAVTALNAGLIPSITDMIEQCAASLARFGIEAPLLVVRGDGTLMTAEWSKKRPVETVCSGPAASLRGFAFLAEKGGILSRNERLYTYDIGGTTTDVGCLAGGEPTYSVGGAVIGGTHSGIRSVDVESFGLGGDSLVRVGKNGEIAVGPEAVTPLLRGAAEDPEIHALMQKTRDHRLVEAAKDIRIVRLRKKNSSHQAGKQAERFIENTLERGAAFLAEFEKKIKTESLAHAFASMIADKRIEIVGFTPTDALAALGKLAAGGNPGEKTSLLGARLLGGDANAEEWCKAVLEKTKRLLSRAVAGKIVRDDGFSNDASGRRMIETLTEGTPKNSGVHMEIRAKIGGMGAPSGALKPAFVPAERSLTIEHYATAGAVGAAIAPLRFRCIVDVERLRPGSYRAFTPWGKIDEPTAEACAKAVSRAAEKEANEIVPRNEPYRPTLLSCKEITSSRVEGPFAYLLSTQLELEFGEPE